MNKLFTKIAAVVLGATMAVGVGAAVVSKEAKRADADYIEYKQTVFNSTNNSKGVGSYTDSWYNTTSGFRVDIENFNNNNNQWGYIKAGASSSITTHEAIDKEISKVSIAIDAITAANVTSMKLYSGSASNSITTELGSFAKSTGTQAVEISSPAANKFYKLEFVASDTKKITISSIKFYYTGEPEPSFEPDHAGTAQDPYSVADALGLTQSFASTEVAESTSYVKGVIKRVDEIDENTMGELLITDGTNDIDCSGVAYCSSDKTDTSYYVDVGYEIVVFGYLQKYQGTQMVSWDDDDSGDQCYLVSSTKATVTSFTASVSGTHLINTHLVASDFTTSVSYSGGPSNIEVPDLTDLTWTVRGVTDGTLIEGDNAVVLSYWGSNANINVTGTVVHVTNISFSAASYTIAKGVTNYQLTPTFTPAEFTDSVTWSSSDTSVATVSDSGVITSYQKRGQTTITVSAGEQSATCVVKVRDMVTVTDEITISTLGVTGSSYSSFSNKSASNEGHSDAIYGGACSAGTGIQLNTSSPNAIVSTASGGNLKSITITWNSSTSNSRTIDVYGKNSAYTSGADLYNGSTQGTKLGSIVKGTSTVLNVTGSYTFVGLRAVGGALYMDEIDIAWLTPDETNHIDTVSITTQPTKDSYAVGETLDVSGMVLTATYEEEGVDPSPVAFKVFNGDTEITDEAKYAFTDTDLSNGSKSFIVKAVADLNKTATLTISTITPAYPKQINFSTSAKWTDSQTLAGGSGRWTVVFSDASHNVTNVKIGDSNTSFEIGGVAVDTSSLAKNYSGQTGTLKYTDPTTNITVSKNVDIIVNPELSVDEFQNVPEYVLSSSGTANITAKYTSINGALTSFSVTSNNTDKLTITNASNASYDATEHTGTITFTINGAAQGQVIVTTSVTYGTRTESKSFTILVRDNAPVEPTEGGYQLVTSLSDITTGQYIIAANTSSGYKAASGAVSSSKINSTNLTVVGNVATPGDANIYTITKSGSNYTIKLGNKYIAYTSSTDVAEKSEAYNWTVSSGVKGTIRFNSGTSGRALAFRAGTTNKFGGYATSNITAGGSEYYDLELFKYTPGESGEKTSLDYVNDFVNDNMLMDLIPTTDNRDTNACRGADGYYLSAKKAWNAMVAAYEEAGGTDNLQTVFQNNFPDAYARFLAWASACNDGAPFDGEDDIVTPARSVSPIAVLNNNSDATSSIVVITIISVVSLTAIGGYFFLRKRREQ